MCAPPEATSRRFAATSRALFVRRNSPLGDLGLIHPGAVEGLGALTGHNSQEQDVGLVERAGIGPAEHIGVVEHGLATIIGHVAARDELQG